MEGSNHHQSETDPAQRIIQSKEDIKVHLSEYKDKVLSNISLHDSTQNHIITQILSIFDSIKERFSQIVCDIEQEEAKLDCFTGDKTDELDAYMAKYVSSDLRGLINSYEEVSPIDLNVVLSDLHRKLDINFQQQSEGSSELMKESELLKEILAGKEKEEKVSTTTTPYYHTLRYHTLLLSSLRPPP